MNIDLQKIRREAIRWFLLVGLNAARPIGCYESPLLSVVRSEYPDATEQELRRELDYLNARELIHLRKEPSGRWWSELTRAGVDVAEYTVDVDPGIMRPEKYWAG